MKVVTLAPSHKEKRAPQALCSRCIARLERSGGWEAAASTHYRLYWLRRLTGSKWAELHHDWWRFCLARVEGVK